MVNSILQAVSVDAGIIKKIGKPGFLGMVHSVFDHAINFTDMQGHLLTVVSHHTDDAPQTIRVRLPDGYTFKDAGVMPGYKVTSHRKSLSFGGKVPIDITTPLVWQGHLPTFPRLDQRSALVANLTVLREVIRHHGSAGGMKVFYDADVCEEKNLFARELKTRAKRLLDLLGCGQYTLAAEAGQSLLGLGCGHTPAGDDFLAGLITVWHLPEGPFDLVYQELGQKLADAARSRTTAVSHAMLNLAANGRARARVISLLESMTDCKKQSILQAVHEILKIGSSSGTDLAVGLAAGLELGLHKAKFY